MARALKAFQIFGILLLVFQAVEAMAAGLLWPLPESHHLTSAFGKYRRTHLHGGIDLGTNRQQLPCVAVDDGWVERIAVTPGGYGRTVYLRLSDGRTAVYAHLSRFASQLESFLRAKQLEAGTYRIDFAVDSLTMAFKRGETIAWTGSSGVGPPHLHFELRQGAKQEDPFLEYEQNDTQRPIVTGLRLVEATSEKAARYARGQEIRLAKGKENLSGSCRVSEGAPFVLLLKAHDPLPNGQHRPWTRCVLWQEETKDTLADVRRESIDLLSQTTLWASVDYLGWRDEKAEWWRLHAGEIGDFVPFRSMRNEVETFILDVYDMEGNRTRVRLQFQRERRQTSVGAEPIQNVPGVSKQGLHGFELALHPEEKAPPLELTAAESGSEIAARPEIGFYYDATLFYRPGSGNIERGTYLYERVGQAHRFLSAQYDQTEKRLTATISHSGVFGVARDAVPPTLSVRVEGRKLFFKARDGQTGIDSRSIRCRVDGQTAIAEYEPEEGGGPIWAPFTLTTGSHDVLLQAVDKAGNEARLEKKVTVPKGRK